VLDLKLLGSWIQPQHLREDVLKERREEFTSHPARMLVLRHIFRDEVAARLGHFITAEAQVETLYGLHSVAQEDRYGLANVTEEQWVNAPAKDRFFKLNKFVSIAPDLKVTPSFMTYVKFQADFNKPGFKRLFEEMSGLSLEPKTSTFHSFTMRQGDSLGWHDDTAMNYRLAFVFYLSEGWQPEFGGALHMVDPMGKLTQVEAEYNSLVIFEVNGKTNHRIAPVEPTAGGRVRATISGWLHKPELEH
jgi:Rps23 Pro-64 3,4-dihydroxylase Tpa1-like proline 4-hydroxylase